MEGDEVSAVQFERLRAWTETKVIGRNAFTRRRDPGTSMPCIVSESKGMRARVIRACADAPTGQQARPKLRRAIVAIAWTVAISRRVRRTADNVSIPTALAAHYVLRLVRDGTSTTDGVERVPKEWEPLVDCSGPLLLASRLRKRAESIAIHSARQASRLQASTKSNTDHIRPCEAPLGSYHSLMDAISSLLYVLQMYEQASSSYRSLEASNEGEAGSPGNVPGSDSITETTFAPDRGRERVAIKDAARCVMDALVPRGHSRVEDAITRRKEESDFETAEVLARHARKRVQEATARRDHEAVKEAQSLLEFSESWRREGGSSKMRLLASPSSSERRSEEDICLVLRSIASSARGWMAEGPYKVEAWETGDNRWWKWRARGISLARIIQSTCKCTLQNVGKDWERQRGKGMMEERKLQALVHGLAVLPAIWEASTNQGADAHASPHAAAQAQARARRILDQRMQSLIHEEEVARGDETTPERTGNKWGILTKRRPFKDEDGRRRDAESLLAIAREAVTGPPTDDRRAMLSVAIDMLRGIQMLEGEASQHMLECEQAIEIAAEGQSLFKHACNTGFLIDYQDLIEPILSAWYHEALESRIGPESLPYLIAALRGPESCFMQLGRGLGKQQALSWSDRLESDLLKCVVHPLYEDVEADLRLHLHASRSNAAVEANPAEAGLTDLSLMVNIGGIRFPGRNFDIRHGLLNFLTRKFHSHVAVARSSWMDYTEMARLCGEKYGLYIPPLVFPPQIADNRRCMPRAWSNLEQFLQENSFSLTTHSFFPTVSATGSISAEETLTSSQTASVLRTRGFGALENLLQESYDVVVNKVELLARILGEKGIKARMQRESHLCREHKVGGVCRYEYQKGSILSEDLQRIKVAGKDLPAMKQLYDELVQLGNAIAVLRLLRLGALRRSQECGTFIAASCMESSELGGLKMRAQDTGMSDSLVLAFANLESAAAEALGRSGGSGVAAYEYMEKATQQVERYMVEQKHHPHMTFFYLCIPAISIIHVQHVTRARARIQGSLLEEKYAEDGFALGTAFLLSVLRQTSLFDSLGWFQEVRSHNRSVLRQLHEQLQLTDPRSATNEAEATEAEMDLIHAKQDEMSSLEHVLDCAEAFLADGWWSKHSF